MTAQDRDLPSVSVVVPTRSRPELLERAVRAIVAQDYAGSIECLIVFDQEAPVAPQVDAGEGRSIRLLTNERTPGLAGTRNTGIFAATGDLVAFCDDDDEWLASKLTRQVAALEARPDVAVVASGVAIVNEGTVTARVPATDEITFRDLLRSRVQEIHPSSFLVRRDALINDIDVVDEALPGSYGEDYDWLLRATRLAPVLVVRAPLVRVYWHRSSFFADRWRTMIDAITYLIGKHPEFRSEPRGLARLYGRIAFASAAVGDRRAAVTYAMRSIRRDPRERRAYLALAVSTGAISAERLMRLAHRTGRGI